MNDGGREDHGISGKDDIEVTSSGAASGNTSETKVLFRRTTRPVGTDEQRHSGAGIAAQRRLIGRACRHRDHGRRGRLHGA